MTRTTAADRLIRTDQYKGISVVGSVFTYYNVQAKWFSLLSGAAPCVSVSRGQYKVFADIRVCNLIRKNRISFLVAPR